MHAVVCRSVVSIEVRLYAYEQVYAQLKAGAIIHTKSLVSFPLM